MADQKLNLKVTTKTDPTEIQKLRNEMKLLGNEQVKLFNEGKKDSQAFKENQKDLTNLANKIREVAGVMKGLSGAKGLSGFQLLEAAENVTVVAAGLRFATQQAIQFGKALFDAANKFQAANLGLESLAKFKGIDPVAAQNAVSNLQLVKDGLITVSDAALALKNLLASGFSLEESINLIKGFGDSAAFGRQSSLEFGYAITSATEGLKNQNSILVDNAGVTKNLSVILKEAGFAEKDLQRVTIDKNVRTALYNGLLKETAAFTGDASRLTETFAGKQQKLAQQTTVLKQEFGLLLQNALTPFFDKLINNTSSVDKFRDAMSGVASVVGTIADGVGALMDSFSGLSEVLTNLETLSRRDFIKLALGGRIEDALFGKELQENKISEFDIGNKLLKLPTIDFPKTPDSSSSLGNSKGGSGRTPKEVKEDLTFLAQKTKELADINARIGKQSRGESLAEGLFGTKSEIENAIKFINAINSNPNLLNVGVGEAGKFTGRQGIQGVEVSPELELALAIQESEERKKAADEVESKFANSLDAAQKINSFLGLGADSVLNAFTEGVDLAQSILSLLQSFGAIASGGGLFGFLGGLFGGGGGGGGGAFSPTSVGNISGGSRSFGVPYILTTEIKGKNLQTVLRRVDKQTARLAS